MSHEMENLWDYSLSIDCWRGGPQNKRAHLRRVTFKNKKKTFWAMVADLVNKLLEEKVNQDVNLRAVCV